MNPTLTQTDAERSLAIFPSGSNGEFNLPPDLTMVIAGGLGCNLWDTEGRRYVDFSMGWGSSLVGHGRPEVAEAVVRQASQGANFAYTTEASLALAEEIVRLSPACERLRFCASGTEATMYGLRLACAFTGRSRVIKFEGAYHGGNDVGVTSLFPQHLPDFPTPEPSSDGIDHIVRDHVLIAPYNDLETTRRIITTHAEEVAAVIVEPLHRCLSPVAGFLEGLREITAAHGILLIFDEVVTGFRLAYGGAQEYYGVVPDLVAYGKALGGGYPIGAYGGRFDIMDLVREDRLGKETYVWTASTLGGNPISTTAAGAALSVFRQSGAYEHLHEIGAYLREGMRQALQARDIAGQIVGDGPLAQVIFTREETPVVDYRSTRRGDAQINRAVMLGLFSRGIFLNPMGTKLYLSLAHDKVACDVFLDRFDDTLAEVFSAS